MFSFLIVPSICKCLTISSSLHTLWPWSLTFRCFTFCHKMQNTGLQHLFLHISGSSCSPQLFQLGIGGIEGIGEVAYTIPQLSCPSIVTTFTVPALFSTLKLPGIVSRIARPPVILQCAFQKVSPFDELLHETNKGSSNWTAWNLWGSGQGTTCLASRVS